MQGRSILYLVPWGIQPMTFIYLQGNVEGFGNVESGEERLRGHRIALLMKGCHLE